MTKNKVTVLEIWLGKTLVGYLSNIKGGKNTFIFDESYINLSKDKRPILSLSFMNETQLKLPQISSQALPPFFSNMLPEGDYRTFVMNSLGLKSSDEFTLFKALSEDCPGNIIVKSENIPLNKTPILNPNDSANFINSSNATISQTEVKKPTLQFSLAGVQVKFSMRLQNGRYTINRGHPGNIIVKMPSLLYPHLPENEFSMMHLAKTLGVEIPEIKLVPLKLFEDSIDLKYFDNQLVYVIQRFDRFERSGQEGRVHCEDFAQALGIRPHQKYDAANYESIARIILALFPGSMNQLEQFIIRIFTCILLGNTDAHLKNWTILYEQEKIPTLSPAYDIVSTLEYLDNQELALNFGKTKNFYEINEKTLVKFSERINVDKRFILNIADKVVTVANESWPSLLRELPISSYSREALRKHWRKLKRPFNLNGLSNTL